MSDKIIKTIDVDRVKMNAIRRSLSLSTRAVKKILDSLVDKAAARLAREWHAKHDTKAQQAPPSPLSAEELALHLVEYVKAAATYYEYHGQRRWCESQGYDYSILAGGGVAKQILARHADAISALGEPQKHWKAKYEDEKRRRVYYQDIVYNVCSQLEYGKPRTPLVCCGTVDTPTTQVRDAIKELLAERNRLAAELAEARKQLEAKPSGELRFVCDAAPGPEGGRFVEVEDASGNSIRAGEWRQRGDGLWELRVFIYPMLSPQAAKPVEASGDERRETVMQELVRLRAENDMLRSDAESAERQLAEAKSDNRRMTINEGQASAAIERLQAELASQQQAFAEARRLLGLFISLSYVSYTDVRKEAIDFLAKHPEPDDAKPQASEAEAACAITSSASFVCSYPDATCPTHSEPPKPDAVAAVIEDDYVPDLSGMDIAQAALDLKVENLRFVIRGGLTQGSTRKAFDATLACIEALAATIKEKQ